MAASTSDQLNNSRSDVTLTTTFLTSFSKDWLFEDSTTWPIESTTNMSLETTSCLSVGNVTDSIIDNIKNCLYNNSAAEMTEPSTTWIDISLSICLGLVALVILVGNSLVLISILKRTELQTPSNVYIFNLAITDLASGINVGLKIVNTFSDDMFDSLLLCPMMRIGTVVHSMMLSVFMVTGIAVDRLIAVHDPYNYKTRVTTKRTIGIAGLIWCYSFSISYLPQILGFHHWEKGTACYLANILQRNVIFNLIGNFFFASLVIIVAYISLFKIASRHIKQIAAQEMQGQEASRFKKHLKASKTLLTVIGTFVVCWWPYVLNLINLTLNSPHDPLSPAKRISNILLVPLFMNSAVNPMIYARKLQGFKMEFVRILTCYKKKNSVDVEASGNNGSQ